MTRAALIIWAGAALFSLADAVEPHPDDIYWADGFFLPGGTWPTSYVWAITEFQDRTVIGGTFEVAGSEVTDNIASWDGEDWESFGAGADDYVFALTVYDDKLVAGGWFLNADTVPAHYIAAWDGSSWSPLGAGLNEPVYALCVYGGHLFAGGNFTTAGGSSANYIAAWDGNSWMSLGSGTNGYVRDMVVYDNKLVICGYFTQAGGNPAGHIAVWDGSTWSELGQGMNGSVTELVVNEDLLFAAGFFTVADGQPAERIAVWTGTEWSEYSGGFERIVYDMDTHNGQIVVGSKPESIEPDASAVFISDGSTWSQLGSQMRGICSALESIDGRLFAGGDFGSLHANFEWDIAFWEDSIWQHPVGNGANYPLLVLAEFNEKLIAGGQFDAIGGTDAYRIAAWDNNVWEPLDTVGTEGWSVNELVEFNGDLVAAGFFSKLGGVLVENIAAWDGNTWSPLGTGISTPVYALTTYDNNVIAGGYFNNAGGVQSRGVAAWDGSGWHALSSGINGTVKVLTVYDNRLIAGGSFDSAGGLPANNIAVWDGTNWETLGSGVWGFVVDEGVHALAVYNRILIVGGAFTHAGDIEANGIAAWNGADWLSLGSGMTADPPALATVAALTVYNNKLVAGGYFDTASGVAVNQIAKWDGSNWSPLGSGVTESFDGFVWHSSVYALTEYQDYLMVGGNFLYAGGKLSTGVAKWTKRYPYGLTANEPDSLYAYQAFALKPIPGTISLGYYSEDYGADDINQSTVSINDQIIPLEIELLTSHPTLEGEVLAIEIDMRELVQSSMPLWGRAYHPYTISGQFNDGSDLSVNGAILIIGHVPGDVNGDGNTNVADLTYLVEYLFVNGPAPDPLENGDINCDGAVNITDLTSLVDYLFLGGPVPTVCP